MNRLLLLLVVLVQVSGLMPAAPPAGRRVPKPEFDSGYQTPVTTVPAPQNRELLDVAMLVAGLGLAAWASLWRRSRKAMLAVTAGSLLYFGFWRGGCTCAVGALQRVLAAVADPSLALPVATTAFFFLPLLFTLLFGRVYCAGVCPLGALQDLFLLRPVRLPEWLGEVLGVIPYLYLGLVALFALTGAAMMACRLDPFAGVFHLAGTWPMVLGGAAFLALSTVVGRPYCRFLCPYGIITGWLARVAWKRVSITSAACVDCRLCEEACPFDAIRPPTPDPCPESRPTGIRRLALLLVALPVLAAAGGWTVSRLHGIMASCHPEVRLSEQLRREDLGLTRETTPESRAFRAGQGSLAELFRREDAVRRLFLGGAWLVGMWAGLVFGCRLIALSVRRRRRWQATDTAGCIGCGRCYTSCPREHERHRAAAAAPAAAGRWWPGLAWPRQVSRMAKDG